MPNTYSATLTEQLRADHEQIKKLVFRVENTIDSRALPAIHEQLHELKVALQGHWAYENWKLYNFLQRATRNDAEKLHIVHQMRKDMDKAIIDITTFFAKYENIDLLSKWQATLVSDFNSAKATIKKRNMMEEETLFPMYKDFLNQL